jgi:hypothetical protein
MRVVILRLVEDDDKQSPTLKRRTLNQWIDIRLQPIVPRRQRTVVRITAKVGSDKGVGGQSIVR